MEPGSDYVGITTPFYCHDGDGNLVMQKRSDSARDEKGKWDPGSGKLEKGLTLEENVKKEVREEYGCSCEIQESLPPHGIFRMQDGERTHWLAIPFFVRVDREEVRNGEPEKFEEIRWFPVDELPENLHSGFAESFEKYRETFERVIETPKLTGKEIESIFGDVENLKHKERRGWKKADIESPVDTIASHSLGSAVIGWHLAKAEGLKPEKVATMGVFHDLMMSRISDLTPEDEDYDIKQELEKEAIEEMKRDYPEISNEIFEMIEQVQKKESEEARLAKKADKLDTLFQAKSYSEEVGPEFVEEFIEGFRKYFEDEDTADRIFRAVEESVFSRSGL